MRTLRRAPLGPFTVLIILACALLPVDAAAGDGTIFGYNLGIAYEGSTSYAEIGYDAPTQKSLPSDCVAGNDPTSMRCTAFLGPSGSAPSFDLFLEAPFKRQGLFYFEPGLTFATVEYKGTLISKPASIGGGNLGGGGGQSRQGGGGQGGGGQSGGAAPSQPLTQALMEMYGINWQGYLRFGVTPRYLPDLLISVGGGVQTVGGRLKIFKEDGLRFVVQPEIFGEADLVLVRAGRGALSVYVAGDQSVDSPFGTQLVEDNPSGTPLTNFRLSLQSAAAGVRLLLPF